MLLPEEQEKIFSGLLKRKQNTFCAECGSKSPCWASLAFGVFVCLNCSGAHRALGPSVTRVKSIRLDTWNREWLDFMQIGNTNINLYYEHLLSDDRKSKPNENSSVEYLIKFVRDKYVRKIYANPKQPMDPLQKWKTSKANKAENTTISSNDKLINNHNDEPTKTGKLQKAATVNYPIRSNSLNKASIADFSFFDEIMTVKKSPNVPKSPKPKVKQDNLVSFDDEKPKVTSKSNAFEDFQFSVGLQKPKEQKYSKQKFMSMGGIKPNKQKCEANFDLFPSAQKQAKKSDNLISLQSQPSQKPIHTMYNDYGVSSQQFHHNHQQTCNKNHFATISGDYHVKQQFFVMSSQKSNLSSQKHAIHAFGYESSWLKTEGFEITPQVNQRLTKIGNSNITLESNINLSKLGGQDISKKAQPSVSSWVDEWK